MSNPNVKKDVVVPQYLHIKELSQLKYDAEEKREQSLIQQASQMQTVFSFITAAVFMVAPICIEYRGIISLKFFFVSLSTITAFIMGSLTLAAISQWRWKTKSFPDISTIKDAVLDNPEWKKSIEKEYQIKQWIDLVGEIQECKAKLNDRRVKFIMASMICFFCSIISIIVSFTIAIIIMI